MMAELSEIEQPGAPHTTSATRIAIGIIALGVVIRLSQGAFGRSLWTDEAMLALSVGTRGFGELARPLLFDQVAPLGFLWITKALTLAGGMREWVLRLMPMMAGILTLPVMWLVARRFAGETAALAALVLTALSSALIYFSNEFKPYAVDVLLTAVILGASVWLLEALEQRKRWLTLMLLGPAAVWFSAPSVFVIVGCGVVIALETARRRRLSLLIAVGLLGGLLLISFAAAYVVTYGPGSRGEYILRFWEGSYLSDGAPWELFRRSIWGILAGRIPYVRAWPGGQLTGAVLFNALAASALLTFLLGLASLWRQKRGSEFALLAAPGIVTAVVSLLGFYPITPRLVVFLAPCAFIAMGRGITVGASALGLPSRPTALAAAGALTILGLPIHLRWHYGLVQWANSSLLVRIATETPDALVYVYSRGVPLYYYYTTDWAHPDAGRIMRMHRLVGPGRFGFENQAGPLRFTRDQLNELARAADGGVVLGLPDGMEFRYMPEWSQRTPDSLWAPTEIDRIRKSVANRVTILSLHNVSSADRSIVRLLRSNGWHCTAAERSFGAYVATFDRPESAASAQPEPAACPSWQRTE